MTATALSASVVQALYPSSSAANQVPKAQWEQMGKQKGARRLVKGTTTATSKT